MVLPRACTEAMQLHLNEISAVQSTGRQAVIVMDNAGWHTSKKLILPKNVTLLPLPPASPELNPQEQIWQWLRNNHLCNKVFINYNDIVDSSCKAWNDLISGTGLVKSIATREWANI